MFLQEIAAHLTINTIHTAIEILLYPIRGIVISQFFEDFNG